MYVIPESDAGGCPESRKNNTLLDTGSRPLEADSSGMTIVVVWWCLFMNSENS